MHTGHDSLLVAIALLVGSGTVLIRRVVAQQAVEKRFEQLDGNGDRKVTRDEPPAKAFFKRLDLDGDGAITKPEALEAVRKGVVGNLRPLVGGEAPAESATAGSDSGTTAPAEPPVRAGPKPVRPGDHGIGRKVDDVSFADLDGTSHALAAVAAGRFAGLRI